MLDLNPLFEFSRTHCVAICTVLVPANLLATVQTLLFAWFRRPIAQVYLLAGIASLYAVTIILHVMTWLFIGVVMIPTYVLLVLGTLCIALNVGAIALATHKNRNPRGFPQPGLSLRITTSEYKN